MIYRFEHPYNDASLGQHFVQQDSGLTNEEIALVRAVGDEQVKKAVTTYGGADERLVKANGSLFPLNDDTQSIYDKLMEAAQRVNSQHFRYDLTGTDEYFYYLSYDAPAHFHWHHDTDYRTRSPRKLSIVVQLSDPDEYEGGEFEVHCGTTEKRAFKQKGIMTAFPAYAIHRVTPVTKGVRRAMGMFLVGPHWR